MLKTLFALLLLQTASAFAQPTVSAEVVSDPLQFQVTPALYAVPAVALARDRTGVVIAWVMFSPENGVDRIYFTRLDASLHIAGPVHSIPSSLPGDTIEEIGPSLAPSPSGDGFTLVWMERALKDFRVAGAVYCQLDKDLKPSTPSILPVRSGTVSSPAIVRSGKRTWISAGTYAWEVQPDGTVDGPLDAGLPACDMALATDSPQLISSQRVFVNTTCRPDPGCLFYGGLSSGYICTDSCKINNYSYLMQFVALYTLSAAKSFAFVSDAQPAIQSDGRNEMIAWFRGTQASGGEVVASRLTPSAFTDFAQSTESPLVLATFGTDSGLTRPDIAADDERYVIVWRTTGTHGEHDVGGASIDRAGNVIPLSIATSSLADERDPSVIALGNGRFLVVYEKLASGGDRRIAGRFVTFESRSRAAR